MLKDDVDDWAATPDHERLNILLGAYIAIGMEGSYAHELFKKLRIPATPGKISILALKLEKDGYIRWVQLTLRTFNADGTEKKEPLTERTYFTPTQDGKFFLEAGGYANPNLIPAPRPRTIDEAVKRTTSWVIKHRDELIIGALLALFAILAAHVL